MRLSDFASDLPKNLSRRAANDLLAILRRSAKEFGVVTARRSGWRLLSRCHSIAEGTAVGHRRHDIPTGTPTLFVTEPPWIIAYNSDTRQVLRIIHGAQDFPALFRE
jgi:plasmid stabilization system protein ParE